MSFMTHLFSAQEIEALDEKEIQILRGAILRQIQTSPEINNILKKMQRKELVSAGALQP
jgi:hypothetical protein